MPERHPVLEGDLCFLSTNLCLHQGFLEGKGIMINAPQNVTVL